MSTANLGKLVMVVDDAAENRTFVTAILQAIGYTVLSASSGPECLSLLTRAKPRLILLDIQMPEVDGFKTCRRIRQVPEYRGIAIAFLTARKSLDDVRDGIAAGGDDFILKPVDPRALVERVAHWSGNRTAQPASTPA